MVAAETHVYCHHAVFALCRCSGDGSVLVSISRFKQVADRGSDETVVNGAQLFYRYQFGIDGEDSRSTWLTGLLNSAPYLCCAFIGCWLTTPFNNLFGRRGTIFLTCVFSALACFWQGFVNTWWHMFIARFFLGLGIGRWIFRAPIPSSYRFCPVTNQYLKAEVVYRDHYETLDHCKRSIKQSCVIGADS